MANKRDQFPGSENRLQHGSVSFRLRRVSADRPGSLARGESPEERARLAADSVRWHEDARTNPLCSSEHVVKANPRGSAPHPNVSFRRGPDYHRQQEAISIVVAGGSKLLWCRRRSPVTDYSLNETAGLLGPVMGASDFITALKLTESFA